MDNPFFTALEGSGFSSDVLSKQTNNVLMPFKHYLENSINALENKEVSCLWKPVSNNAYLLKPNLRIWRLTPISKIEVLNDQQGWYEILSESDGTFLDEDFEPDLEDPVIAGKGGDRQRFELNNDAYRSEQNRFVIFLPDLEQHLKIQWSGYNLSIRPLSVALENVTLVHVDGQECKVVEQNNQHLTLEGQLSDNSTLTVNGQSTSFQLLSSIDVSVIKQHACQKNGSSWLLFSKDKPSFKGHKLNDITKQGLAELSLEYLSCGDVGLNEEHWSLSVDKEGLILEALDDRQLQDRTVISCTRFSNLRFVVESRKTDEKWIQLIEKDGVGDDTGKSELDYFVGDNQQIKILDSTQRKHDDGFRVLKTRPEERQILLSRNSRGKRNWNSEYPDTKGKANEIRVSVDTSQLKRQKEAINQLMNRPASGHQPLIQLLQDRHQTRWQDISPVVEDTIDWQVLTDPKFDGCDRQREFVGKALATTDFAILDGPPGTGKTTSILELIYQLVSSGKRVLLSASTHAAINNVLERVKEKTVLSEHIFPLRIGNESNAIGVEEYQFDKQLESLQGEDGYEDISKQLMVDASNLVCGTTIGILRLFNDKDITLDRGEPPFDVMIIDECSKTTFQEFLVPARFAKRWVLVGDVRQLSPFTDREQIVANLDNLMLEPPRGKSPAKTLSLDIQSACFLLEELRGSSKKADLYRQPMMVPVSTGVINALRDELQIREKSSALNAGFENIIMIQKFAARNRSEDWLSDIASIKNAPWQLYASNLCFVDENVLSDLQPLIPDDMLILHEHWQHTQQASQHKRLGTQTKAFKIKTNDHTNTIEIQKQLLERLGETKWSEEVCWRLEREYWLRLSKNYRQKTGYLNETLERLFPKSVQANGRIHILKNIAFPSILEALSGDGLEKRKKDDPTTLNNGFSDPEKYQRHSTLAFQHRMHPDISSFPREQFYPPGVLANGSRTELDRAWDYQRYQARNIWLDIRGNTHRNTNEKEVHAIIRELKAFCDWAAGKSKNSKKEAYDVAVLTFYKGQEKFLREALQQLSGNKGRYARFDYKGISIKLATVDYFQGQEADVVFLSMVNSNRDGFMDSPNRLNVSITRARYQMIVVGHHEYFSKRSRTDELRNLAKSCVVNVGAESARINKKKDWNGKK